MMNQSSEETNSSASARASCDQVKPVEVDGVADLSTFVKAIKVGLTLDHDGNPVNISGYAVRHTEAGSILYSVSMRVSVEDLHTAKKIYQRQPIPGFKLREIEGILAEHCGVIQRTQLSYAATLVSQQDKRTAEALMEITKLNLKGGGGRGRSQPRMAGAQTRVTEKVVVTLPAGRRRRGRSRGRSRSRSRGKKVAFSQGPSSIRMKAAPSKRRWRNIATDTGQAWAELFLNPMGKTQPAMCGYPDGSATNATISDFMQDYHLEFPTRENTRLWAPEPTLLHPDGGQFLVAPTIEIWDASINDIGNVTVNITSLPLLNTGAFVRIYLGGTPTDYVANKVQNTSEASFGMHYPQWGCFKETGAGCTGTDTAFDYIETVIPIDQMSQQIGQCVSYRCVAKGITAVFTMPQLETQGFITAAQFDSTPSMTWNSANAVTAVTTKKIEDSTVTELASAMGDMVIVGKAPAVNLAAVETAKFLTFPAMAFNTSNISPATLVQAFHNAYVNKVSDGAYMPFLTTQRDNRYAYDFSRPISLRGQDYNTVVDRTLSGWNAGVMWAEGITPKFSIKLKFRVVMELVPAAGTVIATFSRPTADEDKAALETVWAMRNKMAHAYPSCYNDWGWLQNLLEGAVNMIPVVGPWVSGLVKPAWNWIGGKVSGHFGNPIHKDGDVWYDAEN